MSHEARLVSPGPADRTVRDGNGCILKVPFDWELLPPGDAALTRRVKTTGPSWTVRERRRNKWFSLGVWADAARIAQIRESLRIERQDPRYQKRRAADQKRREHKQKAYVSQFREAVLGFLAFAPKYHNLAERLADAIASQSTPVGSGTVARTQRISIERRAESATIAWLRHHTTGYDSMKIERVKGRRREVRQILAEQSRQLLAEYRKNDSTLRDCPLERALSDSDRLT